MRHSLYRLIPLFLVVLAIGIPVGSVLADECSEEDCIFWVNNFSADADWDQLVLLDTNLNPTDFFDPVRNYNSTGNYLYSIGYGHTPYDSLGVKYVFDSTCSITDLTVGTYNPPGSQPARMGIGLKIGGSWSVFENRLELAGAGSWAFTIDTADVEEIGIQFTSPQPEIQGVKIEGMCEGTDPGPGGDLTFPLASEDAQEGWGTYDLQYVQDNNDAIEEDYEISDLPNTVYAFSNDSEAKVSAVAEGDVINIQGYTGNDCDGAMPGLRGGCSVAVPGFMTEDDIALAFNIEIVDAWLVTVEDSEDSSVTYTYWLANLEVDIGDHVVAGCVLGRTLRLKSYPSNLLGFLPDKIRLAEAPVAGIDMNGQIGDAFASPAIDAGITTIVAKVDGEPVQLYPLLSQEPDQSNCEASALTNCTLDNPDLQQGENPIGVEGWNSGSASPIPGGGVHIGPGGSIYQSNISILPDVSYTLRVMARVTTPIDSFYPLKLQVGSQVTTKPVTENNYQLLVWELGELGVSDLSMVGVFNQTDFVFNSEFPVEVDVNYICLVPDTVDLSPNGCYFRNNSFDARDLGWVNDGDITFSNSQAVVGHDGIFEQTFVLLPNEDDSPASYTVSAFVRLYATSAYTGQVGKEAELLFKIPEFADYAELGTVDSGRVDTEGRNTYDNTVNVEHIYVFSQVFEVTETNSGLFSFKVQVTDTEGFLKGFRIDQVCLQSNTEDGSFPGQPGGGGFDPPFTESCGVIPTPMDNNISSWTYFHWKNLERFFKCDLMVKLNQIASTVDTAWKTTRLFMRWAVVLANRVGDWITSFLWWLGGHLHNIAVGQVTTVYDGGGGNCSDLFCVLEALINGLLTPIQSIVNTLLAILNGAASILFDVIGGLLTIIVALITQMLGFLQLGQQLLGTLVSAYNSASPVVIEGIPQCSIDPRSSGFCIGIWILDNTIFSGTGAAIIPVLTGILSIHLLLWVVGEFKRTVTSMGSTA